MNNTNLPVQNTTPTKPFNKGYLIGGLIILGTAVFGISLYTYFSNQTKLLKDFKYKILDFGIKDFTLQTIKGTLTIQFISTSEIELVVKEFFVDFFFNGARVGYVSSTQEMLIPAKSSSVFSFEYTLNPQLVFTNFTDILAYTTRQKDGVFEMKGKAIVKSGFITLPLPIEYKTTISELLK